MKPAGHASSACAGAGACACACCCENPVESPIFPSQPAQVLARSSLPLFTIPLAYLPALLQHEMKALPLALTLPLATLRENRKAQFFQEITTRDEVRKGKS